MRILIPVLTLLFTFAHGALAQTPVSGRSSPALDVVYVPTPQPVVDVMLRLAEISEDDLLYDLGSGDGRIVITAARMYGARGIGIDIDPERIAESNSHAQREGVTGRVTFIEGDLFDTNLRPATAVTLYLLPSLNVRLRPKLLNELRPGTPVVSHAFDMGDWEPDKMMEVNSSKVYLWRVPAEVEGEWELTLRDGQGERRLLMHLEQRFQKLSGIAESDAPVIHEVSGRLDGIHIGLSLGVMGGGAETRLLSGRLEAGEMSGTITSASNPGAVQGNWSARRSAVAVR